MKKTTLLILAGSIFALAACGEKPAESSTPSSGETSNSSSVAPTGEKPAESSTPSSGETSNSSSVAPTGEKPAESSTPSSGETSNSSSVAPTGEKPAESSTPSSGETSNSSSVAPTGEKPAESSTPSSGETSNSSSVAPTGEKPAESSTPSSGETSNSSSVAPTGEKPAESSTPSSGETSNSSSVAPTGEKPAESSTPSSGETSNSSSVAPTAEKANGAYTYVYEDCDERANILGKLEKYAVENNLTGLTLYQNGGYVMYDPAVKKGTNNYIVGYGFGILGEGEITSPMSSESNENWKYYYHTYQSSDDNTIAYMNSKGSTVGDNQAYVASSYYETKMNEFGDGYEWTNCLATERPVAVDLNPVTNRAKTFKFHVKTGDNLKYNTLSEKYAKYNGQKVTIEDYITPYKIYYTKSYKLQRSSENLSGSGSIAGSADYYTASESGFNETAWENIGIKSGTDSEGDYLQFTFNQACTPFYAMYYLSSSMFAPVPEQFIKDIGDGDFATGVAQWGNFSSDKTLTPGDNWLSTGAYTIEKWESGQQIVFKKNPYFDDDGGKRYKIPGVHVNILKAVLTDQHASINEFLAGRIHASGIPSDMLDTYKSDSRTTKTNGGSTFKLNTNTCTQEYWHELFGKDGEKDAWECEPAMANKNFVAGLSYAINRKEIADKAGANPSGDYFGDVYLSDPENGVTYNSTKAHRDAVASMRDGTDEYGYSYSLAQASFKKAADELIAEGKYEAGDTIKIQVAWMEASQEKEEHAWVKDYWEKAFNSCGSSLYLEIEFWAGSTSYMEVYNKMMAGTFDIGFGSISGNSYDPLNFIEVLKSDNSSGFTLNWGCDTNVCDGTLVYDNKAWSFDALWTAADTGAYVVDGENSPLFSFGYAYQATAKTDGSWEVTLPCMLADVEGAKVEFAGALAFGYVGENLATYDELDIDDEDITFSEDKTSVTVHLSNNILTYFADYIAENGYIGIDWYGVTTFFGEAGEIGYLTSSYIFAPEAE